MPDLSRTYGAAMIGLLFATFLQGVLTVQTYIYYESFPEDSLKMKLLVACVWIIDTLHLGLISQAVYYYLVTNWGNTSVLMSSTWELDVHLAIVALATIVCQSFFLHRIWIFSKRNKILTGILGCMCLSSLGISIAVSVQLVQASSVSQSERPGKGPFGAPTSETITAFCLGASVDLILAFLLCFYLRRGRSGFEKTNSLISRIIQYTIATGLLTSLYAFGCVITYFAIPRTFIFIAMHFSLGRLYTNALLVTLNSRRKLRANMQRSYPGQGSVSMGFGQQSTQTYGSPGLGRQELSTISPIPNANEYSISFTEGDTELRTLGGKT